MKDIYVIGVKFENYEDIFYEFDYRPINEKDVSDEIDEFIVSRIQDLVNTKNINIILEIHIPNLNYCKEKEDNTLQAINNYYDSKVIYDNNISKLGLKRLVYYFFVSFIFLFLWYASQKLIGDKLLTTMLDTAATVILWQAMTLIFIESKNHNVNRKVNKLFSLMEVKFKYYE